MDSWRFEYGPTEIVLTVVLSVAIFVYYSYTASLIFGKAGVKPWQGWVPFLNTWRLFQLGGLQGWWIFVGLIPVVGHLTYLILYYVAQYRVGRAFGKGGAFVLLAILLSPVWFGVLAWGRSVWRPTHEVLVPAGAYRS